MKLVIALSKNQYNKLLKLLTELPPRDLTDGGCSELYGFDVNGVGELDVDSEHYEHSYVERAIRKT